MGFGMYSVIYRTDNQQGREHARGLQRRDGHDVERAMCCGVGPVSVGYGQRYREGAVVGVGVRVRWIWLSAGGTVAEVPEPTGDGRPDDFG